jgi:AAA domain
VSDSVIVIGCPGAGKTSVVWALSALLEERGVAHGLIESEALSQGWPQLRLATWLAQLEAVVAIQRRAGRKLLLVATTPETEAELAGAVQALGGDSTDAGAAGGVGPFVVCLSVPPELAAARVAEREPDSWPGKAPLVAHARELARSIPLLAGIKAVISTDGRTAREVAAEVLGLMALAAPRRQ